ncbi:hypothetical protein [Rhizobium sp. 18055]|uniref:hypothetical protein n=1 Tax=Rhizobium sp. 18055 TaxID=2681403 RepID=UPI001359540F|nr:hypothetical protein [Rhizobium sp. 18055]
MRVLGIAVLAAATLLAGCQRESDTLVEVSGHIFVFNYRVAVATYLVTLNKKGPMPDGAVAIAEFENPAGGDPLVVNETILPAWDKITLQSLPVHCVRENRPYAVTIRLIDASGKVLQSLTTTVTSDTDQSLMPAKPLVVGPLYTKNPEVFKADGTVDYGSDPTCPAT